MCMDDYIITKQQSGFTIRAANSGGSLPYVWAYSTLNEMLDGLRILYEKQTKQEIEE